MVLRRSRAHVPEVLLCQVDLLSELHFTECSEIFISLKALQRYEQTCIHRCHHCSFYRVMKFSQLQFVHLKLLQQNNVNSSFLLILPLSTTHSCYIHLLTSENLKTQSFFHLHVEQFLKHFLFLIHSVTEIKKMQIQGLIRCQK